MNELAETGQTGMTFGLAVVFGSFAQFCMGTGKHLPKFDNLGWVVGDARKPPFA